MKKLFTVFAAILLAMVLLFAFQPQETHAELYIETNDVVEISETDELYLNLSHDGKFIVNNSEEPVLTVYIPNNVDVAFPIGTEIQFAYGLVGISTEFSYGQNVYIIHPNENELCLKQGGVVTLKKIELNTWVIYGDLELIP